MKLSSLATHGLGETVLSNYAKEHPPQSPLTSADTDYLWTNGVSPQIINLLRQTAPAPNVFTNQPTLTPQNTEVRALVKTAHEKYTLHENREAVAYSNRALKLDPENPRTPLCIKAISEEALHHSAGSYDRLQHLSSNFRCPRPGNTPPGALMRRLIFVN